MVTINCRDLLQWHPLFPTVLSQNGRRREQRSPPSSSYVIGIIIIRIGKMKWTFNKFPTMPQSYKYTK